MGRKQKTQPMIGEQAYEEALKKKSRVQKIREYFTETKSKKIMERNASIAWLEFQLEKSHKKNDLLMTENFQLLDENQKLQEMYSEMCRSLAQNQLTLDEAAERAKITEEQNLKNLMNEKCELQNLNSDLLKEAAENQKIQEDAAKRMVLMEEQTVSLLRQIQDADKKIPEIELNHNNLQAQVKKLEKQVDDWTLYARALWKPKAREALKVVNDDLALCDICHSEIEVREKRASKQQVDAVANPISLWVINCSESREMQAFDKTKGQCESRRMALNLKAAQEELEELSEVQVDLQQYKDTVLRQNRQICELKDTIESQASDLQTTGVFVSQLQDLLDTSQKVNVDLQEKVSMTRRMLE